MNSRKINLLLWATTAVFAGSAVIGIALAVSLPVRVNGEEQVNKRPGQPATAQTSPDATLPLESFASIWRTNFREGKPDPAAAQKGSATPENPGAVITGAGAPFVLVGTIGDSLAMVQTASGTIELKAVGEQCNGAKILAIRPSQVDVEFGGARLTVAKPREASGG